MPRPPSMAGEGYVDLRQLDGLIAHFLEEVFQATSTGRVQYALDLMLSHSPALLNDQRLLFKLKKQQFLDLVHSGDPEQLEEALALAKTELAPLALDAYPEAYAEFKHSMLCLLRQPREPSTECQQPGQALRELAAADPTTEGRRHLAGMLFRTIREALGVRDPPFTVLLRYLLLVHAHQPQLPVRSLPGHARGGGTAGLASADAAAGQLRSPQGAPSRQQLALAGARVATQQVGVAGSSSMNEEAAYAQAQSNGQDGAGSAASPARAAGSANGAGGQAESSEDLAAICQGLLLDLRDPMPLPSEAGEGAPLHFPESHVQALRTSLGCEREEAVSLLRHAKGDSSIALRSAVQATRLDDVALQHLVQDYALFRGLDIPLPRPSQRPEPLLEMEADVAVPMDVVDSSPHALLGASADTASAHPCAAPAAMQPASLWEESAAATAVEAWAAHAPPAKIARCGGRRSPNEAVTGGGSHPPAPAVEAECPGGVPLREGGGTGSTMSGGGPPGTGATLPLPGAGAVYADAGSGRPQQPSGCSEGSELPPHLMETGQGPAEGNLPRTMSERQVHIVVKRIRGLLEEGLSDEVEQELQAASPALLQQHPEVVFLLRRCRFLHLLPGDPTAALAFVRSSLSPLAQENPTLQPTLKSCLTALLPAPPPSPTSATTSSTAAASSRAGDIREAAADAAAAVHAALRQQYSIHEPLLLRLLGHLLVVHSAHFMAQHCKDGFELDLGIPQLRGPGVVPAAEAQWRAARPRAAAPAAARAEAAQALEEGILGQMGPIIRQLRRLVAESTPAPAPRAAVAREAEEGPWAEGGVGVDRQEEGGEDEDEGALMDDDDEEEEEESDEDWQQPGGQEEEEGDPGGGVEAVSEDAILLTQEFSGLPRGRAIELLLMFGGDPHAVMAHLFP